MYNILSSRAKRIEKQLTSNYSTNANVYGSVWELVGNTPLVKLNKIPQNHGLSCDIYVKCEFMNPGGSIKDRIAKGMMEDAIKAGAVQPDTPFVEPTSGNTGIGVALATALLGHSCTIVTERKNSSEKLSTIRLLGAEVIQLNADSGEIALVRKMKDENPKLVMLDQFENHVNPSTHFETTGVEIINALDPVDAVVMAAGTGGTMSGVGHRLKGHNPKCKIIACEPDGSKMFITDAKVHPFLVEGIGGKSVPIVLDKSIVDHVEVVNDEESFLMARELASKEGILCGGSSGAVMAAAVKAAKSLQIGDGKRIVVILPDGIRNYMTKFVSDQWMEAHLFKQPPEHTMTWWKKPISDLHLSDKYPTVNEHATCSEALRQMEKANVAVVVNSKGWFIGAVTKNGFRDTATNPMKLPNVDSENFDFNESVSKHLQNECYTLAKNGKKGMPTMGLLSRILDITNFVVIGSNYNDDDKDYFIPEGVVTADDVLDYIYAEENKQ